MYDFIYKPPENVLPEDSKMYVKFARNITFLESYLKQKNIKYAPSDLEDTPLGRGYVIRRDENG